MRVVIQCLCGSLWGLVCLSACSQTSSAPVDSGPGNLERDSASQSDTPTTGDAGMTPDVGKIQKHDGAPSQRVWLTNGSQSDVQAKIDGASPGDTVTLPPGAFTWGTGGSGLSVNKAIILQGAGTRQTTIILSPAGPTYGNGVISITASATVRDLAITGTTGAVSAFACHTANDWRVTNIDFNGGTGGGYFLYADTYGLIDSCTLTGNTGTAELIFVRGPANSWQTDSSLGTANAVYVEDCTFNNEGYVCDANSNARMVIRYSTMNGSNKVDGHGLASNTPARGVRHMEVYGNAWTSPRGYRAEIEIRGGTGMIFDNTSLNTEGGWFFLSDYGYLGQWPNFGNTYQTPSNYPITDQIGLGKDPKVGGSEPFYVWNNTRNQGDWTRTLREPAAGAITLYGSKFAESDVIAPDRDYFWSVAAFDGSGGIGRGTRVQMNALVPTKKGVGFWVTDEGEWNATHAGADGQLYIWNGSAWVLKYRPYPYPHPLRDL